VGGSELAFRLLCRRHGADLCYTPMMYSGRFAADAAYRAAELQTCAADAPLVAHFCGNHPATLLAAAKLAEPHCVAVDLNLVGAMARVRVRVRVRVGGWGSVRVRVRVNVS